MDKNEIIEICRKYSTNNKILDRLSEDGRKVHKYLSKNWDPEVLIEAVCANKEFWKFGPKTPMYRHFVFGKDQEGYEKFLFRVFFADWRLADELSKETLLKFKEELLELYNMPEVRKFDEEHFKIFSDDFEKLSEYLDLTIESKVLEEKERYFASNKNELVVNPYEGVSHCKLDKDK